VKLLLAESEIGIPLQLLLYTGTIRETVAASEALKSSSESFLQLSRV
jgi:hypothetical protein